MFLWRRHGYSGFTVGTRCYPRCSTSVDTHARSELDRSHCPTASVPLDRHDTSVTWSSPLHASLGALRSTRQQVTIPVFREAITAPLPVMRLYMHSLLRPERGCSVTQHQVSARQSACTHEKEDLTTSRFVRVIHNAHIVSIKLGTVTPLPSMWTSNSRTIGGSSSGLAVLPARVTTLPCPASVSSPASEGLSSP